MDATRTRWKAASYATALAALSLFVLVAAWRFSGPKPVAQAPQETKSSHVYGSNWVNPTPLGDDLERGRWKAGDPVADVLACYNETIRVTKHGEFTTIAEPNAPEGGHYQLVAIQGRLKAASQIALPDWLLRFSESDNQPRHSYFDALTKEERVAHDASYRHVLAVRYATSSSGLFAYSKVFLIGPGKLSNFGR